MLDRGLGMILLFWSRRICHVASLRLTVQPPHPPVHCLFREIHLEESKCKRETLVLLFSVVANCSLGSSQGQEQTSSWLAIFSSNS